MAGSRALIICLASLLSVSAYFDCTGDDMSEIHPCVSECVTKGGDTNPGNVCSKKYNRPTLLPNPIRCETKLAKYRVTCDEVPGSPNEAQRGAWNTACTENKWDAVCQILSDDEAKVRDAKCGLFSKVHSTKWRHVKTKNAAQGRDYFRINEGVPRQTKMFSKWCDIPSAHVANGAHVANEGDNLIPMSGRRMEYDADLWLAYQELRDLLRYDD